MVRRCIICGRASNTHRDISFHQFPKNRIIRFIWIDSISVNKEVKDWHRICSSHFSADDFTFKNKRKILRLGAIPKMEEVKDKVGSCETSLEHDDVNLMSNSLIDVDCCPDIDVSNESPPSTSERLKIPSKNTKKKKKKSKVVNSKEVTSPKKSNECKQQTSDKEYSKTDTPQLVDTDVETYVSNNYVGENSGKKLKFFDSLDDHTSKYRTMTDISMDFGQYSNQMSNNTYGDKNVLSGNTPFQCDFCFKTFEYRSNLLVHKRTHTGEKPYGCDVCGLAFMMHGHLVRHQRTHTGEKPCTCDVCGKSFPDEGTLVRHKRTHSGEKPYECDVCGQSFSERGNLVRHKRRTHPTSNNAYGDKNFLTGNTPLQCNLTITGEKKYECDVCGLAFHILSKLVIHLRKHTGEKPYACDVCGKSFSQQNHLVAHNRTHTGEKPYVCNICSHSFSEKKHLVTHFRTHTGEKPYACELCGKSFSHRHNLVTHNRTHTGEKPYACNVCHRSFSEKGSLVKHNRTHTGERPHECGQCGKKFSTSRDCKRHTLNVHSKKINLILSLSYDPLLKKNKL